MFVTFAFVRVSAEPLKPHERADPATLVNWLTSVAPAGVAETAPSGVPGDPDGVVVGVAAADAVGGAVAGLEFGVATGLLAAAVGLVDPPQAATRHKVLTAKAASRARFPRPSEVSYGMTGLFRFRGINRWPDVRQRRDCAPVGPEQMWRKP